MNLADAFCCRVVIPGPQIRGHTVKVHSASASQMLTNRYTKYRVFLKKVLHKREEKMQEK